MVSLWLDDIPSHNDFAVPHMLSLTLVRTIIILKFSPNVTHLVDPWYNLLPTSLSRDSEREVRVGSSQTDQYQKWCIPRSSDKFLNREPLNYPLYLVFCQIFEQLQLPLDVFQLGKHVGYIVHSPCGMEGYCHTSFFTIHPRKGGVKEFS